MVTLFSFYDKLKKEHFERRII